jgi:hypothetical protein
VKIPSKAAERDAFFQDLILRCNATTETRREFYKQMRAYFLFGCEDRALNQEVRFNKIHSHVETVLSFVFSQETTKFAINLGVSVNADEHDKVPPMLDRLHSEWHDSDIDARFAQAVKWSAPYGKMLLKLRPKVYRRINRAKELEEGLQIQAFVVEPSNLGVLREDRDHLKAQEAFCETFQISPSELRNQLMAGGKSSQEVEEILSQVQGGQKPDAMSDATPVDRLIVTAVQGDAVTGNASVFSMPLSTLYRPTTKVDLIRGYELYVYDDEIGDWRVVTYVNPSILLWDRPIESIFLSRRLPYVEVCLNPTYDYFWGHSEVERLIPLQDLRNERMKDIIHLLRKQAHPPAVGTGVNAIPDEMRAALDTPDGLLTVDSPAAEVKQLVPELPKDLWQDVATIDAMFDEVSGLTSVNQGKGAAGVRSESHAAMLSNLGSTRIKERSLTVEDSLDELATLMVEIMKRYDKRPMREDEGVPFLATQFPEDFEAKVDGHSNSPIFVDQHEQKAFALLDRKVIDREGLLRLIEIPMRASLIKRLKEKIEPAEAAAAQEEVRLKEASIMAKRSHGGTGPPVGAAPPPALAA